VLEEEQIDRKEAMGPGAEQSHDWTSNVIAYLFDVALSRRLAGFAVSQCELRVVLLRARAEPH
jgi:hypothetical protein